MNALEARKAELLTIIAREEAYIQDIARRMNGRDNNMLKEMADTVRIGINRMYDEIWDIDQQIKSERVASTKAVPASSKRPVASSVVSSGAVRSVLRIAGREVTHFVNPWGDSFCGAYADTRTGLYNSRGLRVDAHYSYTYGKATCRRCQSAAVAQMEGRSRGAAMRV